MNESKKDTSSRMNHLEDRPELRPGWQCLIDDRPGMYIPGPQLQRTMIERGTSVTSDDIVEMLRAMGVSEDDINLLRSTSY